MRTKTRSIEDMRKRALDEMCKLSMAGLQYLDDLNVATFFKATDWPSIAICVRMAMLIKDRKHEARKAKTKEEQRGYLRAARIFKRLYVKSY